MKVQPGYIVMTHLTHRHDGSTKGTLKVRVLEITGETDACWSTAKVKVLKSGDILTVPLEGIVAVRRKETFKETADQLVNKLGR